MTTTVDSAIKQFYRFHDVLGECEVLRLNATIDNLPVLSQKLKLLIETWQKCLPALKKHYKKVDTKDVQISMNNIDGSYGEINLQNLGNAIQMCKRTADRLKASLEEN
jgi:hypothetical protein